MFSSARLVRAVCLRFRYNSRLCFAESSDRARMPSSARLVRAFSRRLYGGFSFSVRLFYFFQSRLLDVFYSTFFFFFFSLSVINNCFD